MNKLQLLSLLVLIGISQAQSSIELFAKVPGCENGGSPAVSSACSAAADAHKDDLDKCANDKVNNLKIKFTDPDADKNALFKEMCQVENSVFQCIDIIKDSCTSDDITKIKQFANQCFEDVAKFMGVDIHCNGGSNAVVNLFIMLVLALIGVVMAQI